MPVKSRMGLAGPGEAMDAIIALLEAKSGKSLDAWVRTVDAARLSTRKERTEWLMSQHGIGRVAANVIASHAEGNATDYNDQAGLLTAMYAGPKAALKPIYDRLLEMGHELGPDFGFYHCTSQTTFKRSRQFAWVRPSTRTRVDLGLALPGLQPGGRLLAVSGTNDKDRVRLRIALASIDEVDGEVASWLKRAYLADR